MSIALQDNEDSGVSGAVGKSQDVIQFFDTLSAVITTYPLIVGNSLILYDITDPANIDPYMTIDLSANTGVTATAVNQIAPRCYIARGTGSSGSKASIVNYNTGGNCYVQTYEITQDVVTGRVASFVPIGDDGGGNLGYYLLGSGAANGDVNQIAYVSYATDAGGNSAIGVIFDSDIIVLTIVSTTGPIVIGTIAGGGTLWGITVLDDSGTSSNYVYATEGGNLHCWNVAGDGMGGIATTSVFTIAAGDEAHNVYAIPYNGASIPFSTTYIAVIVVEGGASFVRFYDSLDGSFLGEYECQSADLITDLTFTVNDSFLPSCMYVVTDGTADNFQTVDISDISTPLFGDSQTVPAGTGYPLYSVFNVDAILADVPTVMGGLNGAEGALITGEVADCAGAAPPDPPTGKIACYAVGDFLYSVDDTPRLEVTNISDPTTPTSSGTLALSAAPTGIWVNEHNAIVSYHGGFWIINIDDPAAPTLETTKASGDDFDFIVAPGGIFYLSGEAAKLAVYDPGFDPPGNQDNFAISNGGISSIALEGSRVYFADIAPTGNSKLYSFATGGIECSSVQAGLMSADEIKVEEIHGRHGKFKGALVAESAMLTKELETSGIILIDTVTGDRYRVQMISSVLTETLI